MDQIKYFDRLTKKVEVEKVYGEKALRFLYGPLGKPLLPLLTRIPLFSALYGYWQHLPWTRRKIEPFIKAFDVDPQEFAEPVSSFRSFNDFFIRKLKPEARPIDQNKNTAVIPADGRYRCFQNVNLSDGFVIKGEKFDMANLLEDEFLAEHYQHGSMVMARLCPSDYHRFHFPCDCVPGQTRFINGWLYSVNPIAIRRDIHIFTRNKRTLCILETETFGKVLYMEIGATNVGSIHQTYIPNKPHPKGAEKGFFSFGASALILLFEPGAITLGQDLLEATNKGLETRCLLGQSLGKQDRDIKQDIGSRHAKNGQWT